MSPVPAKSSASYLPHRSRRVRGFGASRVLRARRARRRRRRPSVTRCPARRGAGHPRSSASAPARPGEVRAWLIARGHAAEAAAIQSAAAIAADQGPPITLETVVHNSTTSYCREYLIESIDGLDGPTFAGVFECAAHDWLRRSPIQRDAQTPRPAAVDRQSGCGSRNHRAAAVARERKAEIIRQVQAEATRLIQERQAALDLGATAADLRANANAMQQQFDQKHAKEIQAATEADKRARAAEHAPRPGRRACDPTPQNCAPILGLPFVRLDTRRSRVCADAAGGARGQVRNGYVIAERSKRSITCDIERGRGMAPNVSVAFHRRSAEEGRGRRAHLRPRPPHPTPTPLGSFPRRGPQGQRPVIGGVLYTRDAKIDFLLPVPLRSR